MRTLFRVLGPLGVEIDGGMVDLGQPRQRALLGALVLHHGEVVSTDALTDALWGEEPPRTAPHSLQTYVSGLRAALGADRIETRAPGYVLHADADEIDACRFEQLVDEGLHALEAGDPTTAAEFLGQALAWWRGEPLADVVTDHALAGELARLRELHLRGVEAWVEAMLALGRHEDLLPDLERLTRDHPLRERLWGHRILALYRSGRSADALRAYQELRERLAEELGTDPSADVTALYERILVQDPHLLRAQPTVPVTPEPSATRNPYKGLQAFTETDAGDFFGRDDLVREMIDVLSEPGRDLLAVVGPSGSGKSSVVRAGLVPALRGGALAGLEDPDVLTVLLGDDPVRAVAAVLATEMEPPSAENSGWLTALLGQRVQERPVVLVLDQFEELFVLVPDPVERRQFLDALGVALDALGPRLRVVITLRADHFDRPLQDPAFARRFVAGTVAVLPLSAEQLEAAAVEPARRVGVQFESGLVAALVADLVDQPGTLPLFQYALTELFERRRSDVLMLDAYRALGGVQGAVSRRAEDLFGRLAASEQVVARQVFLRLVHPGDHASDSRRRVPAGEIAALDVDPVPVHTVLDRFGRARLLSFDRDPGTGTATVEMAHDALLEAWERLRGWVDQARGDLRRRMALAAAVAEWRGAGEDADFLLRGARLEAYEDWASTTSLRLTTTEQRFLDDSIRRRDHERAAEDARREEEQRLRRRGRRRAWGVGAAIGGLVVAAAVAVVTLLGGSSPSVALVYAGPGGTFEGFLDHGFDEISRSFDAETARVETFVDAQADIRSLCVTGTDVVFLGGFNYALDGLAVAADCPDTTLIALDADALARLQDLGAEALAAFGLTGYPSNLIPVTFATEEGSFLAGVVAALESRTGVVGFVGGQPVPLIETFRAGFEAGAAHADPDVTVLATYVTDRPDEEALLEAFGNPTLARVAAQQLFDADADVVYAVAGDSGSGVLDAAMERTDRRAWVIGVDTDWYETESTSRARYVLTSVLKRLDVAMVDAMKAFVDGSLTSRTRRYGLAEGGIELSRGGGHLTPYEDRLTTLGQQIVSGDVNVPTVPSGPTLPAPTERIEGVDGQIEFDGRTCRYVGPTSTTEGELLRIGVHNTSGEDVEVLSYRAVAPPPLDPTPTTAYPIPSWVDQVTFTGVMVPSDARRALALGTHPGTNELACIAEDPVTEESTLWRAVQIEVTPAPPITGR